ncbi:hypothetical protein STRDD10_00418 [Streptococcus sp. DD10]|nr:hypothetical protein STRDD10_00418 [Streptococcus sp. DD10]
MSPTTQNSINYQTLHEDGLMHVVRDKYSRSFKLGDASYSTAQQEEKENIIETCMDALNSLDAGSNYQLLVINRRVPSDTLDNILFEEAGDGYDDYREELNEMIGERFATHANNFEVHKYVTIGTEADDPKQGQLLLQDIGVSLGTQFQESDIYLEEMTGLERMRVFSELLRNEPYIAYNYKDIALSGLSTKSFIAPSRIQFQENKMRIDEKWAKVLYIRTYPNFLSDRLIKDLTTLGLELAISIQARPYESMDILKNINDAETDAEIGIIKSQRKAYEKGNYGDVVGGGRNREISEATKKWRDEVLEFDQKIFSGVITVFFKADSLEELTLNEQKIKRAGRKLGVEFDDIYYYQEEALNTVLPIGECFLNVKKNFMRDMTTANVATQVPFTNVDLKSSSPRALYYGQNQLSNNIITLDRKRDLNTGSGVVLGSSGSGKSTTVKAGEIIPTLLKYTEDRVIILDPEDEYSDIGREFGAQMVDVSIGSNTHLNLLDLPDISLLQEEDNDPIGDKANLLMGLFEEILSEVTDGQFGIIDRVTALTYERFLDSSRMPTLRDWHGVLKEQPEEEAHELALAIETYATGSQDIFSYQTNVNLNHRFVIFNLKKLSHKLKPFALMVIQDYIWNQVVENQGKLTTRIYFDEVQLLFKKKTQAVFFTELYSRVRKYGAIPTAITQNVETLFAWEEGRKLLSNSEFMILLKQKKQDLAVLKEVVDLTDKQIKYIERPKAKGTGLIVAGPVVVPFENPIPDHTKLYELVATDA